MRNLAVIAVSCLALCSCEIQRSEMANKAKVGLVGMSKEQIRTCMGVPQQKAAEGQTEVWSYASGNGERDVFISGGSNTQANVSGNNLNAFTAGSAFGSSSARFCTVSVVMKQGVVSMVNYSGPTGGLLTQGEQCAFAVQACVK